jgi:hypothetical protein
MNTQELYNDCEHINCSVIGVPGNRNDDACYQCDECGAFLDQYYEDVDE